MSVTGAELVVRALEHEGVQFAFGIPGTHNIELYDALQRIRFEHPETKVVVLQSGKDNVFCAGANIRMLAGASHAHKVGFCKFTNETRNAMEQASIRTKSKPAVSHPMVR